MTGTLLLRVEQAAGTPADFYHGGEVFASVEPLGEIEVPDAFKLQDLVIPISSADEIQYRRISDLPLGDYRVRVRLPSGHMFNSVATIRTGQSEELTFTIEGQGSETLNWQSYAGVFTQQIEKQIRAKTRSTKSEHKVKRYDNLKQIRGIGPAIETALNRSGIDQIAQIAEFGAAVPWTIAPFAKRLNSYGWIEQAATILANSPVVETSASEAEDATAPLAEPVARVIRMMEGCPGASNFLGGVASLIRSNLSNEEILTGNIAALHRTVPNTTSTDQNLGGLVSTGTSGPLRTWHFAPGGQPEAPSQFERGQPLERLYVATDDARVQWLICLPKPWPTVEDHLVGIDLTFDRSDPDQTAIGLIPHDARVASLLGFMRAGDVRASRAVLNSAKYALFDKLLNPYAAVAGGLVLINARRWGGLMEDVHGTSKTTRHSVLEGEWGEWLKNLNRWSPWLPDAKVLLAWHYLLNSGDDPSPEQLEKAKLLLINAANGGLPVYSWTFRLLVDGLKVLRQHFDATDPEAGPNIANALEDSMTVSMRTDMRQIFAAIRLTPRNRSGLA